MKIFDTMLLDVVLITFPLMVYLLYLAYTKTFNKKRKRFTFCCHSFLGIIFNFKIYNPFISRYTISNHKYIINTLICKKI